MNKYVKSLLTVVPICFVLAGTVVTLYLVDPKFEPTASVILSMTVATIWAFFIVPSLPCAINLVRQYFEKLNGRQNFAQAFYIGFNIGYALGSGLGVLLFLLLLAMSPISGTMWFIQTVKALIASKRAQNNKPDESDVFDIE